jgi:hypothetical protein
MLRTTVRAALQLRKEGTRTTQRSSDGFSLWLHSPGKTYKGNKHYSLLLLFHEWSSGGREGLSFANQYWINSAEVHNPSALGGDDPIDNNVDMFEDYHIVAALIARGTLVRVGSVPPHMLDGSPAHTPRLGQWT